MVSAVLRVGNKSFGTIIDGAPRIGDKSPLLTIPNISPLIPAPIARLINSHRDLFDKMNVPLLMLSEIEATISTHDFKAFKSVSVEYLATLPVESTACCNLAINN